ncbi:MAG: hypothetical protein H0T54_07025 [Geodermatophilaceae bacterium]|nr:hypothetical protein [Geodermatophilaceae bacterium]
MSARRSLAGVDALRPLPRGAQLTRSWSRAYTYGLPAAIALARRDEIAADLHDQLADTAGVSSAAVSRVIATRMLLGVPADLSWRSEQARTDRSARRKETAMNGSPSPYRNLALALGAVLVAWGLVMTAGSAIEQLRGSWSQNLVWVLFVSATLAGVVGLVLLAKRQAIGAALLVVAALGTTLPFYWMPPILLAGIALAAFFVTVLVLQRRVPSTPLTPPIA